MDFFSLWVAVFIAEIRAIAFSRSTAYFIVLKLAHCPQFSKPRTVGGSWRPQDRKPRTVAYLYRPQNQKPGTVAYFHCP